jgi:hypothetical protein
MLLSERSAGAWVGSSYAISSQEIELVPASSAALTDGGEAVGARFAVGCTECKGGMFTEQPCSLQFVSPAGEGKVVGKVSQEATAAEGKHGRRGRRDVGMFKGGRRLLELSGYTHRAYGANSLMPVVDAPSEAAATTTTTTTASAVESDTVCRVCKSSCVDGEFELLPCHPLHDRVCQHCSSCDYDSFEVNGCDRYSDRVCAKCPPCPAGMRTLTTCTTQSDRKICIQDGADIVILSFLQVHTPTLCTHTPTLCTHTFLPLCPPSRMHTYALFPSGHLSFLRCLEHGVALAAGHPLHPAALGPRSVPT